MTNTQAARLHYPAFAREETIVHSEVLPALGWVDDIFETKFTFVEDPEMTHVLDKQCPHFLVTRSAVSPVETWLRGSWASEYSWFDETELEIDILPAGLNVRDVTIHIVRRLASPDTTSLTADEMAQLFDGEI